MFAPLISDTFYYGSSIISVFLFFSFYPRSILGLFYEIYPCPYCNFTLVRQQILLPYIGGAEIIDNYSLVGNMNLTLSYCDNELTNIGLGTEFHFPSYGLEHLVYERFQKAHISNQGVLLHGYFFDIERYHAWRKDGLREEKYHSLQCFDKVAVAFGYHIPFGHFIFDQLAGFINIPSELLDGRTIIVKFNEYVARTYLNALGLGNHKVVQLTDGWMYANDIVLCVSEYGMICTFKSVRELRSILRRNLNLTQIIPEKHTFITKEKTKWGRVNNMKELCEWAKQKYSEYSWVYYEPDICQNLTEISKIMAATKIYLTSIGSILFNDIFMSPGTGIYCVSGDRSLNEILGHGFILDVWMYTVVSKEIKQWQVSETAGLSLEKFEKTIPYILHAIYKGGWPNDILTTSRQYYTDNFMHQAYEKFHDKGNLTNFNVTRFSTLDINNFWVEVD